MKRIVALITPMKRGLKEKVRQAFEKKDNRCTNYPDEKGTESLYPKGDRCPPNSVALITPMKRGLKDQYKLHF